MGEADALELGSALTKLLGEETCPISDDDEACTEVVVFPPHPFISKVKDTVDEVGITVGAQSVYFEDSGAYTGSVSVPMVQSVGCEYILCGHSERRTLFDDDDKAINRKVLKCLSSGLKPILCIGETKDEYDMEIKNEVCAMQLRKDLAGVSNDQMADVVIAYEPVWAIFDDEVAQATRIQYGGSVTPDSVDELMSMPEIDGCLVGGASLDATKFGRIINYEKK